MDRATALRKLREHQEDLRALGVGSVWLFGSVARDEGRESSDVDLLVELDRPMGLAFFRLKPVLESWLECPVDVTPVDGLKSRVKGAVLAEAIRAA